MQRQYRTIGSIWVNCDEEMFNFCRRSAEYDTRSIPKSDIKPNNYQDRNNEGQREYFGK